MSLLREVRYTGSGSIDRTRKLGSLDLSAAQTATAPLFIVTDVIKDGTLAARNYFFINYSKKIGSLFTLPTTTLQYTKSGNVYTVKNTGSVPAVAANLTLSDSTTVSLSDNYVWLEPGETKKITVTSQTGGDGTAFITGVDGFNLRDGNEPVAPDRPTALSARFTANNTLTVTFDEPLDKTSAETIANYRLDGDAAVTAASLGADGVTVTLTVTAGSDKDHTLTVSGVCDRDKNAMVKQTFFVSRGLIGYWQFDEGGGTAVKDGTGNTPDMTVSGPTYETAPEGLGTAMSFNKNKVTGLSSLTLGNHFTISMFMKASSSTPGWGAIFSKGPKAAGHFEFNFDTYNTRNLEFYAPDLSSSGFDSGAKLADDKWHHVGVTLANGTLTMYVDGAAVKTFTGLTGSIAATTEELVFGGLAGYNGTYIGLLDEVRVYDYALSAARMAELAHVYETPCDMTCSVCGGTRTVPHDYSGACDTTCNICGAARLASAAHTYGSNGDACTVCGAELSYETADRADIVDGKVMEVTDARCMQRRGEQLSALRVFAVGREGGQQRHRFA